MVALEVMAGAIRHSPYINDIHTARRHLPCPGAVITGVRVEVVRGTAGAQVRPAIRWEARLGSGGASVLEKPGLEQSGSEFSPGTEEGGERGNLKQRLRSGGGNRYRVLLLDHERHTENYVATVLPRVVPGVNPDEARRVFVESRQLGAGLVTVAVKEHAEFYAQMMVRNRLRATIEPDNVTL